MPSSSLTSFEKSTANNLILFLGNIDSYCLFELFYSTPILDQRITNQKQFTYNIVSRLIPLSFQKIFNRLKFKESNISTRFSSRETQRVVEPRLTHKMVELKQLSLLLTAKVHDAYKRDSHSTYHVPYSSRFKRKFLSKYEENCSWRIFQSNENIFWPIN